MSHFFSQGMCDQLYRLPAKLKKHTDDWGSFFGALGFTSLVEQLALRAVPAESLLTWLTMLTSPHLVEAVLTSESHMALAILVTPEGLYDSHSPRVGLGLVYKAPYIKTASFSEAFFHLKSTSDAEVDKRITDPHLMFVGINEASKVIPLPYVQPLFLDVPTASDVTRSKKPWSPHAFRAFRLHRVIYAEGSTVRTQVAYPRLGAHEIREIIHETLDQVYALRLEALQEMGFIREVDRALAKSLMAEFIRLQLIVGDGLNTSLRAMHADLEATAADLVRDMDIVVQNSTALPSKNPAIGAALHRFAGLVKLKLALPLAQVDVA